MLTMPSKPIYPDKTTNDRSETTARRRRLLEGNWASDLEDFISDSVALDRRAIWGALDTSSNVFKQGCEAFFFFKQKTAYEISACLVGSEMCIRDRFDNCFIKTLIKRKGCSI